jgi:hypothetical protein
MRCFGLDGNMTNIHGQGPIGFAGQVHTTSIWSRRNSTMQRFSTGRRDDDIYEAFACSGRSRTLFSRSLISDGALIVLI